MPGSGVWEKFFLRTIFECAPWSWPSNHQWGSNLWVLRKGLFPHFDFYFKLLLYFFRWHKLNSLFFIYLFMATGLQIKKSFEITLSQYAWARTTQTKTKIQMWHLLEILFKQRHFTNAYLKSQHRTIPVHRWELQQNRTNDRRFSLAHESRSCRSQIQMPFMWSCF